MILSNSTEYLPTVGLFLAWATFFGITYLEQVSAGSRTHFLRGLLVFQWVFVLAMFYGFIVRVKLFGNPSDIQAGLSTIALALCLILHFRRTKDISKHARIVIGAVLVVMGVSLIGWLLLSI